MTEFGLKSIKNPSAIFLAARKKNFLGSSVMVTQEGSRPLLIEIQALVDNTKSGYPKRHTIGLESNRILMILAVLNKYLSVPLHEYDVFVNAVGGVKISEPASDLSVFSAIYSSFKMKPLPHDAIFFGEIGLSGEIRPVVKGQERIYEAQSHGFKKFFLPHGNVSKTKYNDIEIIGLTRIEELINFLNN
jgi:DNA repair protein RadA/Sms